MQVAREWIIRAETRLDDLNKQAQAQFKLVESIMKSGTKSEYKDTPSIQKKDNVIQLARQGWANEAIAKTMKMTIGEVEMILETFYKT